MIRNDMLIHGVLLPSAFWCQHRKMQRVYAGMQGINDRMQPACSVVTDSEFASESANFSSVRPSPSPRIFGGQK